METILSTEIAVSIAQVLTLISLTTFALVFGYPRLALVLNYCFLIYCCYFSNSLLLNDGALKFDSATFPYLGIGLAILLLAMMGLVHSRE
ncbi:MAG TPA: hypothetical protein DDY17_04030 [Syntrophaceae bacterium]|jgi:hypothetical protein|nr:hypothetical protein [Syntrophaceae bacterium]